MKSFILILLIAAFAQTTSARTMQVMSYNVENLFDAKHDVENGVEKKDWTFLPKNTPGKKEACAKESKSRKKECLETDWTAEKVELRLSQIKDVVTQNNTTLPDFVGLIEIENTEVAGKLAKTLGYDHFEMTTSPDERGVDVVLMYKTAKDIKKISRAEHVVPVDYATRNILEVEFLIDDRFPLTIFVNHWPSLANPDSWRVKAATVLYNRTQEILKKNPNMHFIALGDFNTIDENDPHPFRTVLFKEHLYTDLVWAFNQDKQIDEKLKKAKRGSYYFPPKDQWNWLDRIFVNNNLMDGKDLEVDVKSFDTYAPSFMTHEIKNKVYKGDELDIKVIVVPKRFEAEATTKADIGFSDHFPLMANLVYPDKPETKEMPKAPTKKKKK